VEGTQLTKATRTESPTGDYSANMLPNGLGSKSPGS